MRDIYKLLAGKINKPEIGFIVRWAMERNENMDMLYELSQADDERLSINALWCLTHFPKEARPWFQEKQNELIDRLLVETNTAKKRILLQLLREQKYEKETMRADFFDFCLAKINSECEPFAVRCFSIYCAFKMCRFYPELIAELEEYLNMLSIQNLSPGLKCALRTTRKEIQKLNYPSV